MKKSKCICRSASCLGGPGKGTNRCLGFGPVSKAGENPVVIAASSISGSGLKFAIIEKGITFLSEIFNKEERP